MQSHRAISWAISSCALVLVIALVCGCSSDDGDPAADASPGVDSSGVDSSRADSLGVEASTGDASPPPPADAAPDVTITPCTYTQPIAYVDEGVDASKPCGDDDGTCIAGTMTIDTKLVQVNDGDVGEAYLFASPAGAPMIIFRITTPPVKMQFKIPNIPKAATDACTSFQVGGRIDVGGNNQGLPGGSEDPVLPPPDRLQINLAEGDQLNNLEFTIPVVVGP